MYKEFIVVQDSISLSNEDDEELDESVLFLLSNADESEELLEFDELGWLLGRLFEEVCALLPGSVTAFEASTSLVEAVFNSLSECSDLVDSSSPVSVWAGCSELL